MLSFQTVTPRTLEILKALMVEPLFAEMRLVGGTALALQYGHRTSVDLDLFGVLNADVEDIRIALQAIGNVGVISERGKVIKSYMIDDIKVDLVSYSYEWLGDAVIDNGIRLASPIDIAAMKINAIMGRGTKKDFIDLYYLLQRYELKQILEWYSEKYPEYSLFRALRSLTYFEDANKQQSPHLFINESWEDMKQSILGAVQQYKGS